MYILTFIVIEGVTVLREGFDCFILQPNCPTYSYHLEGGHFLTKNTLRKEPREGKDRKQDPDLGRRWTVKMADSIL